MQPSLYDFSPALRLAITGLLLASGPLLLVYLRYLRATPLGRVHALAVVTLFLTFDLVLFGAFTRLTDSGLGCPDWPGCYGSASPLGASEPIAQAQAAMPTGPVTAGKAWVEMVHRYLAMAVGVLITVLAAVTWLPRHRAPAPTGAQPWWALLSLVWVMVQGLFGALTVTMKLFPAIVSLHLLGGYVLLALLAVQVVGLGTQAPVTRTPPGLHWALLGGLALLLVQAASGAWVSTNYAVLACTDFPRCQGVWWPPMDFAGGFELWRPLGLQGDGSAIRFEALTAIHFSHRTLAGVTLLGVGAVGWTLFRAGYSQGAKVLWGLLGLQLLTGISNVVLGWPMLAAVLHTGGAGAMVVVVVQQWSLLQRGVSTDARGLVGGGAP